MRKTLHLFLLLALMVIGGGMNARADEVTIDLDAQGFSNQDKVTTVTSGNVTLTFGKGTGTTQPAYYNKKSPKGVRLYGNNTLKIDAGEGNIISKVVFTFTVKSETEASSLTTDAGTFNSSSKTWTGDVQSFTLTNTASSGNAAFTKIVVTYSPANGKAVTNLTFDKGDYTIIKDEDAMDFETYSNPAKLTDADGKAITGATISYTSSDKGHADVDENGGVTIDPTVAGTYTITAKYDGDDKYSESSASYKITVTAPYSVAEALDLINNNKIPSTEVYVKGIISRVVSSSPHSTFGSLNYYVSDDGTQNNQLYVYSGLKKGGEKFTSASEISVGDVVILKGKLATYGSDKTPELNKSNTLEKFLERTEAIDESSKEKTFAAGHNVTVTVKRTFADNAWNTLVLPFDLTKEQIETAFGTDVKVAAYNGATENTDKTYTLNFNEATTMSANVPVLIYGAKANADGYTFKGVEVKDATPTQTSDGFNFVGTYVATTVPTGNYFFNSENKIYKAGDTQTTINGTRATFAPVGTATAAKALGFNIDGTTTSISAITIDKPSADAHLYNLAGQRVNRSYKGIVLRNGKKFIQK